MKIASGKEEFIQNHCDGIKTITVGERGWTQFYGTAKWANFYVLARVSVNVLRAERKDLVNVIRHLCFLVGAAHQASLTFIIPWSLLKLMSIESVMPSNHLILCHPLLLTYSIFPSIRIFSNELALHIRWPKYWSFSISPSSEYSGLISFRIY